MDGTVRTCFLQVCYGAVWPPWFRAKGLRFRVQSFGVKEKIPTVAGVTEKCETFPMATTI